MKRQKLRKGAILVSFLLFPVVLNYMSPYLIIQGAAEGVISGSFLLFALLFAGSLFFGRAWCGWLCPGAGLQEACFAVRGRRVKGGDWIKWVIWAPWLALIVLVAARAGGYRRIDPFYLTDHGISVTDPLNYAIYYSVLGLAVLLAFTAGKRSFCHHVCWMAPFMIAGRKLRNLFRWPALHLTAQAGGCAACGRCARECPMSLPVAEMVAAGRMERAECILCGSCVDGCPNRVIRYAWREGKGAGFGRGVKKTNLGPNSLPASLFAKERGKVCASKPIPPPSLSQREGERG